MTAATKAEAREAAFLRSLRPPELRDAPDEWYGAVASEAYRIARADWRLRQVVRGIEEARKMIAEDTFPSKAITYTERGRPRRCLYFSDKNPVVLCWFLDVAGRGQPAHLSVVYRVAAAYKQSGRPWHRIDGASIVGSLRTWQLGYLVERTAPCTWGLTSQGRELLDLVFGEES